MRLIDADALIMNLDDRYSLRDISREYRDTVVYELENAPTIDAVEVVRCKDCIAKDSCNLFGFDDMDFCSAGKRKDETD